MMGRGYLYPQAWQGVDMTHCPSWLQGPRREGVGGGGGGEGVVGGGQAWCLGIEVYGKGLGEFSWKRNESSMVEELLRPKL